MHCSLLARILMVFISFLQQVPIHNKRKSSLDKVPVAVQIPESPDLMCGAVAQTHTHSSVNNEHSSDKQ